MNLRERLVYLIRDMDPETTEYPSELADAVLSMLRDAITEKNEQIIAEIAEVVEAWAECPHLSHDGTGTENEWRCMGCGQVELHTPDPEGDIWTSDGRFRSEVVLDADYLQCARNIVYSGAALAVLLDEDTE